MELTSDYKLMYDKSERESDTIRQIIKLHTLDVLCGNEREKLTYVDALYPAIEGLFGVDTCIAAIGDSSVLETYYESNFDTDVSYRDLHKFFAEARKTCNKMQNEETLYAACNKIIDEMSKIYDKRVTKKM